MIGAAILIRERRPEETPEPEVAAEAPATPEKEEEVAS